MEIIDWINEEEKGSWDRPNLVAWALIEAMSEKSTDVDKVFKEEDKPFNPKALEVEFKVNGVEVSFKHVAGLLDKHISQLETEIKNSMIKDTAQKLINDLQEKVDSDYWKE